LPAIRHAIVDLILRPPTQPPDGRRRRPHLDGHTASVPTGLALRHFCLAETNASARDGLVRQLTEATALNHFRSSARGQVRQPPQRCPFNRGNGGSPGIAAAMKFITEKP
jgi:hypothetical protein